LKRIYLASDLFIRTPDRTGDIANMYADPTLANNELNWKAELNIFEMCRDTWNWQSQNPQGY
jgi:UDP-glucose 4-epimerase